MWNPQMSLPHPQSFNNTLTSELIVVLLCLVYLYSLNTKQKNMVNEKMKSIITDKVTSKLTQMLEELSTNDFTDEVIDTYFKETGVNLEDELDEETNVRDEVGELIGEQVYPLLQVITEYITQQMVKGKE